MNPNFIIVGAAKSGTTALWSYMGAHPKIFFPVSKEPGVLILEEGKEKEIQPLYNKIFRPSLGDDIMLGEASTIYTKLEHSRIAAARARRLFGSNFKIIYVMRHPVDRAVSHHAHMCRIGRCDRVLNRALIQDPDIIERGQYLDRIEPWIEQLGLDNVLLIKTEDMKQNMLTTLNRVLQFLDLDSYESLPKITRENRRDDAVVRHSFIGGDKLSAVLKTHFYRVGVKPHIPSKFLKFASNLTTRPVPSTKQAIEPTMAECEMVWEMSNKRFSELGQLLGMCGDPWQFQDMKSITMPAQLL